MLHIPVYRQSTIYIVSNLIPLAALSCAIFGSCWVWSLESGRTGLDKAGLLTGQQPALHKQASNVRLFLDPSMQGRSGT